MSARRVPTATEVLVFRASRRSFVAAVGVIGAALLGGCPWPPECYVFVNQTTGPVRLFLGSAEVPPIAPGESHTYQQHPVRLPDEGWWSQGIDHEGQFAFAMRRGVTLVDDAGRRRSFDAATLRAYMFREPDYHGYYSFYIRPDLFEAP